MMEYICSGKCRQVGICEHEKYTTKDPNGDDWIVNDYNKVPEKTAGMRKEEYRNSRHKLCGLCEAWYETELMKNKNDRHFRDNNCPCCGQGLITFQETEDVRRYLRKMISIR